jgi:hypothetical protein
MVVTWNLLCGNAATSMRRNYILYCSLVLAVFLSTQQVSGEIFTNSFLVRLHGEPGNDVAHRVASRNGFENLGPVSVTCIVCFMYRYIDPVMCMLPQH